MAGLVRWEGFSADPRRAEVARVRASDRDRETAVDALRDAYADGRLDRAEFDRRSAAALASTLLGELAPLLADLEPERSPRGTVHEEAVRRYRRETRDARNGFIAVSTITTTVWGATSLGAGELLYPWPLFPIAALGVGWLMQRLKREERLEHHERAIERRRRRRARQDED